MANTKQTHWYFGSHMLCVGVFCCCFCFNLVDLWLRYCGFWFCFYRLSGVWLHMTLFVSVSWARSLELFSRFLSFFFLEGWEGGRRVLFCFVCLLLLLLLVYTYLYSNVKREGVNLGGWESREHLGGVEKRETVIIKHCTKNYFQEKYFIHTLTHMHMHACIHTHTHTHTHTHSHSTYRRPYSS